MLKAQDIIRSWRFAAIFIVAALVGCSKSKPEELQVSQHVPYWTEQGEPAENSKEELAKWHQESVALMKALQALEVTSKGT